MTDRPMPSTLIMRAKSTLVNGTFPHRDDVEIYLEQSVSNWKSYGYSDGMISGMLAAVSNLVKAEQS